MSASVSETVADLRAGFKEGITTCTMKSSTDGTPLITGIKWRRQQLEVINAWLHSNETKLCDALRADLHKSTLESMMMEVLIAQQEVARQLKHLDEWTAQERVSRTIVNVTDTVWVEPQPYGVVLIMSPWNYPLQLVVLPLVGAIAAGNCVLVKPSEYSEETGKLMTQMVNALDHRCIRVINGDLEVSKEVLRQKFDYIFFTGSTEVGRVVMRSAAENLTPVTLELGGKCPVFVEDCADVEVTAKRLVWGKFSNAGQTCVAPDYVLCSEQMCTRLANHMKNTICTFYGSKPKDSEDYGRIVNEKHFQNIVRLLSETNGDVIVGGISDCVLHERYIAPTLVTNVREDDALMKDEIFGPVLPFVVIENGVQGAIEFLRDKPKPLAVYLFSKSDNSIAAFKQGTSSGAFMVNDVVVHCGMDYLPFGGVGDSGMGKYHGKYSFDTFSHLRSCVIKDRREFANNKFRYPPYDDKKLEWVTWALRPNSRATCAML